jgi:EmrB/QacA subfamily drug resistance transporter
MTLQAGPGSHRWRWAALSILCVTLLLVSLDLTILSVALPSIVRDLHATSSQLQWIIDAYAVAFAGLLLSLGALGDRVGRKWVFLAGLFVFAAGSAFSAWSGSVGWLTAGRVVMGAGAAALMPCTLSILTNVFSTDRDRGRAIGIWSATAGLGVAIGPILGGFLLVHYWWGSVFLINVPIAAVGGLAAIFVVPNSRNAHAKRPDPVGMLLSVLGFGLLLWAIIEAPGRAWSAPPIAGALAASAALIAGFVVWEHRRTDPMLPVTFFRNRRYSAAIASLALVIFALLGLLFLMTQYLQFVLGFSAFRAGLAIGPVALVLLVTAPFSAVLARRIGTKSVIVPGLLLIALGLGFLSQTTIGDGYRSCLPFFLLIGCGVGLALAPSTDSVMGSVSKDEAGVGSATSDTSMQVGGALGVAVLGTALNLRYQHLMTALIGHHAVPSAIRDVILGSLGGALQVAVRIPGPTGAALADAARRSFVSGMDLGLLIAAVVVAAAAALVLLALPQRPRHQEPPPRHPAGSPRAGNPAGRHFALPVPRPPHTHRLHGAPERRCGNVRSAACQPLDRTGQRGQMGVVVLGDPRAGTLGQDLDEAQEVQ